MSKRVLIINLVHNGDCLMTTAVARQLKLDDPDCHITWAISYKCRQVIENNPDIDNIWEEIGRASCRERVCLAV